MKPLKAEPATYKEQHPSSQYGYLGSKMLNSGE